MPDLQKEQKKALLPGDKGQDVEQLQRSLFYLGYDVDTSGVYDAKTTSAVKSVQEALHIKKDGFAGPKTLTGVHLLGLKKEAKDFLGFIEWLREHPEGRQESQKVNLEETLDNIRDNSALSPEQKAAQTANALDEAKKQFKDAYQEAEAYFQQKFPNANLKSLPQSYRGAYQESDERMKNWEERQLKRKPASVAPLPEYNSLDPQATIAMATPSMSKELRQR